MLRGEIIPGVKCFPQNSLTEGGIYTRRPIEANYYRDGEWDVFGGDEWYLDDDEDTFFQADAEDIFLSLDEEADGDASSWVSEEDGRLVRTYARVKRGTDRDDQFMFADDVSEEDEEKKEGEPAQGLWQEDDEEELDSRISIFMFADETGDQGLYFQGDEERRRTIHMEDYL